MAKSLYEKAEQFAVDSFTKTGDTVTIRHLTRTVYWIKYLRPDADEALLIAAITHDIDRGFKDNLSSAFKKVRESDKSIKDDEFIIRHPNECARIISKFLSEQAADKKLIERVNSLVSRHELGGDEDQNLLKDADSLSFLENNIEHFLTKGIAEIGKEKVKEKFDYMFERITSEKARQIARPWYEQAIKKLGF